MLRSDWEEEMKELDVDIKKFYMEFDTHKVDYLNNGNKSAGRRARVSSIELHKALKRFRILSSQIHFS